MHVELSGGDKLDAHLKELVKKLGGGQKLRVGFLEGATYPDNTPVALVAAVHEFGGSIQHPGGTKYTVDSTGKAKFVTSDTQKYDGVTAAHTISVPARPFFRPMLAAKSPGWGVQFGKVLKVTGYDLEKAFGLMGELLKSQLQESIRTVQGPPLKASTVRAKGFDTLLIDTGHMLNSVDYDVQETT